MLIPQESPMSPRFYHADILGVSIGCTVHLPSNAFAAGDYSATPTASAEASTAKEILSRSARFAKTPFAPALTQLSPKRTGNRYTSHQHARPGQWRDKKPRNM